jgi:hypothetical protein
VQVALPVGAVEWLRALAALLAQRLSLGQPDLRLAPILLAVAAFSAAAALVFRHRSLRLRLRIDA